MFAYVALLLALAAPAFASNTFVCYDMALQGYYQASTSTITSNGSPFSPQLMLCPACLQASAVGSFVVTPTTAGATSTSYSHGGTIIACVSSCPSSSVTTATLSISTSGITWTNGITSMSATSTYVGQVFANGESGMLGGVISAYSVALTNIECATP